MNTQKYCIRKQERRSGKDRRRINPARYSGIEKRLLTECRDLFDRREAHETWLEYQSPR
jgi:hypothetical protein